MDRKKMLSRPAAYLIFINIGFWFFFLWGAICRLAEQGNILWTGSYFLGLAAVSLVGGTVFGGGICFLVYKSAFRPGKAREEWKEAWHSSPGKVFGVSFVLMVLFWLPGYLAYYPGICAYDMPIQTGQIVSGSYNDHHPIAHTLLIEGAMRLGEAVFGEVNAGIAALSLLQLLFLAGTFAFGMAALTRCGVRLWLRILLLLYGVFFPFHMYMSVSITKDTVFSAFFVLQVLALCLLLRRGENVLLPGKLDFLLFFGTIGMILFRNNGRYAMLVLLAALALVFLFGKERRKLWGRLLLCLGIAFILGNLLLSALFGAVKAQQGDKREMLSMPIQQLARCMLYHGGVGALSEDDNTMGEEDKALINDFLLDQGYLSYNPSISDPVKSHTNTYVVRYRTLEFAETYLRLLVQYPGDFVNAALALNAGYLSPFDESHADINQGFGEKGLGYVQTRWVEEELAGRGIYKDSKWEWLHERLEDWADANGYLQLPLIKYLFVPGTWLWLLLFLWAYLLVHRRFGMCIPLVLFAGYYITLFLGPAVQLRYLYPVMAALPFAAFLCGEKNVDEGMGT